MKEMVVKVKEEFDSEESKPEIDLRAVALTIVDSEDDVLKKLKAAEAEIEALKRLLKDNDSAIRTLLGNNEGLGMHICKLEMEGKAEKEKAKKRTDELSNRVRDLEMVKEAKESQKVYELNQRIKVLEMQKREMEAELCQVKREKNDRIKRILNDKTPLKEYEQKILELASRVDVLEKEKRELEAEAREMDQVMKVLVQQNECLAANKMKMDMEMETARCTLTVQRDIEFPVSNAVGLGTHSHTENNQGPKSIGVSFIDQRRKVEALGCSSANQVGNKRCRSNGLMQRELVWSSPQMMCNAFTANGELCMSSICALYRKHKSLGQWKNCLTSKKKNKGFMPSFERRGMALGQFLTAGDPQGRLKKSRAEFERADPRGLEDCRHIARHHYLELFEIYSSNLDPLFIP